MVSLPPATFVLGLSNVLRRDTITELGATVAWHHDRRVEPFVRVSQQWDRSTDPFRTFSDSRVLVGARITVGNGSGRSMTGGRQRVPSDLSDTSLNGLGQGDLRSDALANTELSYAHIKAGRWLDAADAARAALGVDPTSASAWANLGVALYKLGDVPGARQALERSLALNPKNEALRSVLARMPRGQ